MFLSSFSSGAKQEAELKQALAEYLQGLDSVSDALSQGPEAAEAQQVCWLPTRLAAYPIYPPFGCWHAQAEQHWWPQLEHSPCPWSGWEARSRMLCAPQLRELQAELQAAAALTQEALGWYSGAPAATAGGTREAGAPCCAGASEASPQDSGRGPVVGQPCGGSCALPRRAAECTRDPGGSPRQHGAVLLPPALPGTRPDAAEAGAKPCPEPYSTAARRGAAARLQGHAAGNNAKIHPRCRYADAEPDFAALAARFPALRPYVTGAPGGRGRIDFTDSSAAKCAA